MRNLRNLIIFLFFLIAYALGGCSGRAPASSTGTPAGAIARTVVVTPPTSTPRAPTATAQPAQAVDDTCGLAPVIAPTMPATVPAYTQLDTTTNLHMTGTAQIIDLASYRLKVSGKVEHALSLSYDALRCMPKVTAIPILVCYGAFTDKATWSGVPFKDVLERAGVLPGAKTVTMVSADGFQVSVPMDDALDPENYLAYEWEGQPLPVLHGFPLRAVFPNKLGNYWVKWLVELTVE